MEMLGTETFVGRDSYPAVVIVGYGNPTYSGLHRRGLKSRLRPWKSAQADSASDRVGFNRLARLEQGIYPRRNQWKCQVWKHLSGGIPSRRCYCRFWLRGRKPTSRLRLCEINFAEPSYMEMCQKDKKPLHYGNFASSVI